METTTFYNESLRYVLLAASCIRVICLQINLGWVITSTLNLSSEIITFGAYLLLQFDSVSHPRLFWWFNYSFLNCLRSFWIEMGDNWITKCESQKNSKHFLFSISFPIIESHVSIRWDQANCPRLLKIIYFVNRAVTPKIHFVFLFKRKLWTNLIILKNVKHCH